MRILVMFIFLCTSAFSKETIYCSQVQACELFKTIDVNNQYEVISLLNINGDPHHFDPDLKTIKTLMTVKSLLVAPIELHPILKSIIDNRKNKADLKTIILEITKDDLNKYKTNNKEALAHFWLYPEIYCRFKFQLKKVFWGTNNAKCDASEIHSSLKNFFENNSYPIVLTHDALEPLIKKFNLKNQIISLKGSAHHDQLSPNTLKALNQQIKNQKNIWIMETNITVPINIKSLVKINDYKIEIDTSNSPNVQKKDFHILIKFIQELKNASN